MRSFVLGRAVVVAAVAALAVGGCSSGKTGGSGGASAGAGSGAGGSGGSAGLGGSGGSGKTFHGQVAPGFSTAAKWTADVPWAADGYSSLSGGMGSVSSSGVTADQGTYGVARVVGGTVVVPSFASGGAAGAVVTTLQFLDAKTGKQIASKALPVGSFLGLTSDTVAGQPVVVARYETSQGSSTRATVAFSASGSQVWSSEGQQTSDGSWGAGLLQDTMRAPLFVGGYTVRLNIGKDTVEHSDASYDVLDSTGKSVLHVPSAADQWDLNHVSLVEGYAVVCYDDSLTQSDSSHGHEHFTVYDLAAGAKKVADVSEADSGGLPSAGAVTAFGGKVLVSWLGAATGGFSLPPADFAVIDTSTGTASTPAPLPGGGQVSDLGAMVDPASSDAVIYDASSTPTANSAVVSLSQGTVLWKQQDQHGSLIPLSLHDNTLYGVESNGVSGGNHQLAVKESDGTPAGSDYELAPLAFTADQSPVFIEVEDGGGAITVGVGHAG